MSLLTACQSAVEETGLGNTPATIISNTDPAAVQLLALAKRAGKKLMQKDWQRFLRDHTITTISGTAAYALPTDWKRYIGDTAWDSTNYWPMRGSVTPQTWQTLKYALVTAPQTRKSFRVAQNFVAIFPTPTVSGDILIIPYMRNTPWTDSTLATYRVSPTADTDLPLFPDHLLELEIIWRLKEAKGQPYEEAFNECEREIDIALAQDVPQPILDFSAQNYGVPPFELNVPPSI